MQRIWPQYYSDTHAVLLVVDGSCQEKLAAAAVALLELSQHPAIKVCGGARGMGMGGKRVGAAWMAWWWAESPMWCSRTFGWKEVALGRG
jgi:hypothetical protein